MNRALAGLSFVILLSQVALGQSTTTQWAFEMADVHPSAPGTREGGGFLPEGRFECRGETLLKLIATAYSVDTDLVLGGPQWLDSDRFDITAKAPSRLASPAALRAMLQALLAERFGLAVHDERKDMPVYLLAVGKKGRKLQPATTPDTPDCPSVDGPPGLNHRACRAFTMADLSRLLPQVARNYVDRPVVDMTGIEGPYDFQLDWMGKAAYLAAKANADGPPAVSMFDAIEQLGLKLEPGTRPAPVIVIDHVNRAPAEGPRDADPRSADPRSAGSQSPAGRPPGPTEFEVAEVLPSKPGATERLTAQNGQLEILGYTLRKLIAMAFDVKEDTVAGGPKWLDADRFDVIAKSPAVMSPHAMAGMLKALIVQRFKLEIHNDDQPVPVFALVLGKRSPKLKESDGSARSECKLSLVGAGRSYVCRNTTMAQLAERLPDVTRAYIIHPMIDLTGLKGAYDFTLTWTPKALLPGVAGGPRERPGDVDQPAGGVVQASTPGGDLTVFEAIDKQLGLKLEEQKHPMPVIVIDRVERIPDGK